MRAIPGAADVRIPQVLDYPALRVDVDRERAAQLGITERDVANNLLTSLVLERARRAVVLAQPARTA